MTETVATTVVNPPLATAPQASLLDFALTGLVVALAVAFLYRRLWRSRGACSGCSGGKGKGGCGSATAIPGASCSPVIIVHRGAGKPDKVESAPDQA